MTKRFETHCAVQPFNRQGQENVLLYAARRPPVCENFWQLRFCGSMRHESHWDTFRQRKAIVRPCLFFLIFFSLLQGRPFPWHCRMATKTFSVYERGVSRRSSERRWVSYCSLKILTLVAFHLLLPTLAIYKRAITVLIEAGDVR